MSKIKLTLVMSLTGVLGACALQQNQTSAEPRPKMHLSQRFPVALCFSGKISAGTQVALGYNTLYTQVDGGVRAVRLSTHKAGRPRLSGVHRIHGDGLITFSSNGTLAATIENNATASGETRHSIVRVWRLPDFKLQRTLFAEWPSTVCFSPSATKLYVLGSNYSGDNTNTMVVVNLKTGRQHTESAGISDGEAAVTSPDGTIIASRYVGEGENGLMLLNMKTHKADLDGYLSDGNDWQPAIETTPPLVFIARDHSFVWVDNEAYALKAGIHLGEPTFALPDHERALLMDKRGRLLTVNFQHRVFELWDVRRRRIIARSIPASIQTPLERPDMDDGIYSAASPNGRYVAIAQSGKVQVWRLGLPQ